MKTANCKARSVVSCSRRRCYAVIPAFVGAAADPEVVVARHKEDSVKGAAQAHERLLQGGQIVRDVAAHNQNITLSAWHRPFSILLLSTSRQNVVRDLGILRPPQAHL